MILLFRRKPSVVPDLFIEKVEHVDEYYFGTVLDNKLNFTPNNDFNFSTQEMPAKKRAAICKILLPLISNKKDHEMAHFSFT